MNESRRSDWAALYQAAITFKQTSPWERMSNEDLFAIESPYDAEVGYCSVLGDAREESDLGIFLGDRGLQEYARLKSGRVEKRNLRAMRLHKYTRGCGRMPYCAQ